MALDNCAEGNGAGRPQAGSAALDQQDRRHPMEHAPSRSLVVGEVQDLLLDTQDVEDFLNELARYSAENLSGPRGELLCGITLLRHRAAATVASSSERARLLDDLQFEYADGPCLHSDAAAAANLKAAPDSRTHVS